jgi:hypothetical protein
MPQTRVPTPQLLAAAAETEQHLLRAIEALKPFTVELTDDERLGTIRTRAGLPTAARALIHAMGDHPNLAQMIQFDGEAVAEDLDNTAALEPVRVRLEILARLVADSQLTWHAEAFQSTLAAYRVAKAAWQETSDTAAAECSLTARFARFL